ncbi:MAG: FtsW/RodA/SpoVE family cell cycle protein, partial [SAR324 cluster bacterium]|nr:FtsW/RodA/SpoVE family cell cycle protein [SAR324 cluster bacterium]
IFAVIGEELGFIWIFVLVGIFSLFIWRGFWISWNAPDRFGKYLAFGSTTILSLQIIINLFVVSGLLPTKGLPLPFISYGGSNLLSTLFLTGILLNISHQIIPYQTPPGKQ